MARTVMAHIDVAQIVMAHLVMTYIAVAHIVMAYIVMAHKVKAYIVVACIAVVYVVGGDCWCGKRTIATLLDYYPTIAEHTFRICSDAITIRAITI